MSNKSSAQQEIERRFVSWCTFKPQKFCEGWNDALQLVRCDTCETLDICSLKEENGNNGNGAGYRVMVNPMTIYMLGLVALINLFCQRPSWRIRSRIISRELHISRLTCEVPEQPLPIKVKPSQKIFVLQIRISVLSVITSCFRYFVSTSCEICMVQFAPQYLYSDRSHKTSITIKTFPTRFKHFPKEMY